MFDEAISRAVTIRNTICIEDITQDGEVAFDDILAVLAVWGPCPPQQECVEDLDDDGIVGFGDILMLLAAWGPCPP